MNQQRPFAVFDIDGTLIRWQIYHAISDSLAKQGAADAESYRAIRQARLEWKKRLHADSFKHYESKLVKAYHDLLPHLRPDQLDQAVAHVIDEYKDQTYTYTRDLLHKLKAAGYVLFTISGSHHEAIEKIAAHYGFDDFVGAKYPQKNGRFTGEHIASVGRKNIILKDLISKHKVTLKGSYAVGDSEGDLSMLEMVENPIAFNPDRSLFRAATDHGWKIVVERKNVIYELDKDDSGYKLTNHDPAATPQDHKSK